MVAGRGGGDQWVEGRVVGWGGGGGDYNTLTLHCHQLGAGIAQWLSAELVIERSRVRNPCWNGGRIFFSQGRLSVLTLISVSVPPRVTTVARKKSRSFCQKCRWQVTAKHAYTLRIGTVLRHWSQLVPNMSNDI